MIGDPAGTSVRTGTVVIPATADDVEIAYVHWKHPGTALVCILGADGGDRPYIHDCTFDCQGLVKHGIVFNNTIYTLDPVIERCHFTGSANATGNGLHSIYLDKVTRPIVRDCDFYDNSGGYAFHCFSGCTSGAFTRIHVYNGDGAFICYGSAVQNNAFTDVRVELMSVTWPFDVIQQGGGATGMSIDRYCFDSTVNVVGVSPTNPGLCTAPDFGGTAQDPNQPMIGEFLPELNSVAWL